MPPHRARAGTTVLLTLFVAYAAFYLCRANVESAAPALEVAFGYTKLELGVIFSASIGTYAVGKVVLGILGDRIGGRNVMLIAITGSVLASFAFGFMGGLTGFIICAAINRFFQAGGWGGLVHVVSRWFPPVRHGAVMGLLSSSYEIGNVVTLLLCSALLDAGLGWRSLFQINPSMFLVVGIGVAILLKGEPPAEVGVDAPPREPAEPFRVVFAWLAKKPAFWAVVLLSMLLTFVRTAFLSWTPVYLASLATAAGSDSPISGSIAKTAIFPAAGIVAANILGRLSDRHGPGKRVPLMVGSLAVMVCATFTLAHATITSAWIAALLIGVCGLFLLGPYSLLAGALTLDVAGKRGTATAAGFVDGMGYLASSLAGIGLGGVADEWGWAPAFDIVASAALVAMLVAAGWIFMGKRRRAAEVPVP